MRRNPAAILLLILGATAMLFGLSCSVPLMTPTPSPTPTTSATPTPTGTSTPTPTATFTPTPTATETPTPSPTPTELPLGDDPMVITEAFMPSARSAVVGPGNLVTIVTSGTSGFGWGGYVAGDQGATDSIVMVPEGGMDFCKLDEASNLGQGNANASYVYSIFSSDGSNLPDRFIDLRGGTIVVKFDLGDNDEETFRFLIRDYTGAWYISTTATPIVQSQSNTEVRISVDSLTWMEVTDPAASEMSALDGGEGYGITTDPASTSPRLWQVAGGGIYIADATGGEDDLRLLLYQLEGYTVPVT